MPPRARTITKKTGPGSDDEFTYSTSAGDVVVPSLANVPKLKGLEVMEIQAIEDATVREARLTVVLLHRAAGPAAMRVIAQLDMEELGEFVQAWAEHSGVGLGE
jgi:hypothetical protein